MGKRIRTQDWSFRVNTSLLAICIVDSWLLYSGIQAERNYISQNDFYEILASELIDNKYDAHNTRPQSNDRDRSPDPRMSAGSVFGVNLTPTKLKKRRQNGELTSYSLQRNCRVCKIKKTTFVCSDCRTADGCRQWFCNTSTGRDCFSQHLKDVHDFQSSQSTE